MLSQLIIIFLLISQYCGSIINLDEAQKSSKKDPAVCHSAYNGCRNLDFDYWFNSRNIMRYYMDVEKVMWLQDNLYEVTIHVHGQQQIDLKYLSMLYIHEIDGPKRGITLFHRGLNISDIISPTDYTVTFQVYGNFTTEIDFQCLIKLPAFKIHYEYLLDEQSVYKDTWEWGTPSFTLTNGCRYYDNEFRSYTSFPGYFWSLECENLPPKLQYCRPPGPLVI
ncbi:hypothetical protein NCAS_0D04950 [Naumovozyma castellii]|uniref:Flo11 domain-containing protein n=1 Tax=Naumovozyma castellii TaxID=27288 RepID=G0VET5_NAUCA|nr:hypothetical protein NCAS_0D04950 [Naumovozyma castellii CBS 4309]CCC70076.1 hypothetical protein NCAS_0D04950 [Naumovozyma castellii CBS 4309]